MRLKIWFLTSLLVVALAWAWAMHRLHGDGHWRDLFDRGLAYLIGQEHVSGAGYPAYFREYALADQSNEQVGELELQEIITRSGFQYENHFATSNDGYVTNMIRLINPLANRTQLRQPPVMLLSGGISDQGIWIWASAGQHHPEKWPRNLSLDGPITSWNRSLGFVLANNGYDVWLVGTRGSNRLNSGHVQLAAHSSLLGDTERGGDLEAASSRFHVQTDEQENRIDDSPPPPPMIKSLNEDNDLWQRLSYWNYSMDELAQFELPRQIDKVLELTGARKVSLAPISLSSLFTLMALTHEPAYQKRLHTSVVFMPIINNKGANRLVSSFHKRTCRQLPFELGTILYTEFLFSKSLRQLIAKLTQNRSLRYTLFKALTVGFTGPSYKYQTLLEPSVVAKVLLPSAFKELQHYCQQVVAGQPHRYDHGDSRRNKQVYGSSKPPSYQLDRFDLGTWLLVSAGNDMLATPSSVEAYAQASRTPPEQHLQVEHYNHLDVIAAIDNDERINLPVLKWLNRHHSVGWN